jgi:DHA2 family multidrug resistance protein-like MFS transporter
VTADGLSPGARNFAVAVIAAGTTMAVLDGSIANIALPTISRELQAQPASTVWVVNAFQLAVATTLITFAALGDAIGYRLVYAGGIVVFTIGSLLCALAHALPLLVAARVFQGFGASAIMSVGPALYRTIFPAKQLGRALGISALVVASSATAGPTIGGSIRAIAPWPWLFLINVPIGIADFFLALRALPLHDAPRRTIDPHSGLLSVPAIGLFVVALEGIAHGTKPLVTILSFSAAIAFGAAFVWRQRHAAAPMLPLDIFRIRRFSLAALTSLCSFVAQGLAYVSLPFLLQGPLGYSPFISGLLFTPWPLTIAFVAPVAGRLADRYPAAVLCTIGLAILACGLALLAVLPAHASEFDVVWRAVICGLGFGLFQSPNNREIMGSVPRERSGAASGMLSTVRVTGQSLGAAIVAIVLGASGAAAMGSAMHGAVAHSAATTLWIAAGAALVATIASGTRFGAAAR